MFTKSPNKINIRNASLGEQVERRVLKVLYVVFDIVKAKCWFPHLKHHSSA